MTTAILIEEEIYYVQYASFEASNWRQIGAKKKIEIQEKKYTFQLYERKSWIASSILPNYL